MKTPGENPSDNFTAADDVNRAKAIVLTVWMAMQSADLRGGCEGDIGAIADTLFEAHLRLLRAETKLGVHHAEG